MMLSVVLYYDELYDKLPHGGIGEFLPYYSMYETGKVKKSFIDHIENDITSSQSSRKIAMIFFTVFGLICVLVGIGMIARAFFCTESFSASKEIKNNPEKLLPPKEKKSKSKYLPMQLNSIGEPVIEGEIISEESNQYQ